VKKLLVGALTMIILMAVVLSGCGTKVQANTDSGKTINAGVNQELTIALGSNPTTGYSWQADYDKAALEKVSNDYKADDHPGKQLVGSGGTEYFVFKALQKGQTKLNFTYRRPWEQPTAQDQTQTFNIVVK
jgi:inhibitor of cysteine peptidase